MFWEDVPTRERSGIKLCLGGFISLSFLMLFETSIEIEMVEEAIEEGSFWTESLSCALVASILKEN